MEIHISENNKVIIRMSTDQFMAVAKEQFGIGRNRFLDDYVKFYNSVNSTIKAEIVLK